MNVKNLIAELFREFFNLYYGKEKNIVDFFFITFLVILKFAALGK